MLKMSVLNNLKGQNGSRATEIKPGKLEGKLAHRQVRVEVPGWSQASPNACYFRASEEEQRHQWTGIFISTLSVLCALSQAVPLSLCWCAISSVTVWSPCGTVLHVVQPGLELCLYLLSSGLIGVHHHARLIISQIFIINRMSDLEIKLK